ncbi:hypothetical protein Adeg_0738 [Ammonifex degensii KC4]|uniref:LOB domain-containing protein n=1 Tax=Ammonifex degensii (strain DSM 10501 / KC4) TaxID=429009 RepID=C9RCA7_AMMDK|nr:hypothetical protein Adeg_0738 [Ammonifex degensii KC4]
MNSTRAGTETYCPFRDNTCLKDCALRFAYPDRPVSLCAFHAMAIMLYNIQVKLVEIEDTVKRSLR